MNKTITYGLAASTLILSVALAYTIGANSSLNDERTLVHSNFQTVQANSEWNFNDMGNRMSSWDENRRMYPNDTIENCDQTLLLDEANLDLTGTDITESELEEMLTVLIKDEYKARAEYDALVDKFGNVNPFYQLINAETNHVDALSNLFEAYDLDVPEDHGEDFAVIPNTLEEAYAIGVEAEIANIALYQSYLELHLPEAVETVFINLMTASEHHLAAFQSHVDGYVSTRIMGRDIDNETRGRRH